MYRNTRTLIRNNTGALSGVTDTVGKTGKGLTDTVGNTVQGAGKAPVILSTLPPRVSVTVRKGATGGATGGSGGAAAGGDPNHLGL
ncbi:unnamed protein product, partial [Aureobasidium pullulans]